jgi:predicted deacylase
MESGVIQMRYKRLILASILVIVALAANASAQSVDRLLSGSIYSTNIYINQAAAPGPSVLVLGGVHGDEPAGSLAAEEIRKFPVKRGTLIVIPRVNTLALDQGVRTLSHIGDINRAFPGKHDGSPSEQIAYAIALLLEHHNASMLIDLHEGRAFHRLDKTSVGQTILFAANTRSTLLAMAALDHINSQITEPHKRFSLVAHPVPHSASYYAAERYNIAAFTLETAGVQPLAERIDQHVTLVSFLLQQEGLL